MIQNALVVDDDRVFRDTMVKSLEKRNLKACSAGEPSEAVALFRKHKPDLIILDYRMPLRDGLSLLREMRNDRPNSVFILLTGHGEIPLAVEAMKQGADNFLTKPTDVDIILREANQLFEKKKQQINSINQGASAFYSLDYLEKNGIEKALAATKGNVSKAAILLGIDRRTLQRKMKRMFALFAGFAILAALSQSFFCFEVSAKDNSRKKQESFSNLIGDDSFVDDRSAWDKTYSREEYVFGKEPAKFLTKHLRMLPKGRALDIAMGEGRNAVYLAKKGFRVEGVDISAVGIRKALLLAAENGVAIEAINADLNTYKIKENYYETIMNFYYLQRNLFPKIKKGLKKGGIIIFETYTIAQLKNKSKEQWDEKYLLKPGELKSAFQDFEILYYAETNNGKKAIASMIARKPK